VVIKKRKEKKKRAKLSAEALGASREAEDPFATQDSQLGVTTQITANPRQSSTRSSVSGSSGPSPGDDPFLTESEKAILTRVASRDGEANANVDLNLNSSGESRRGFSEAVKAFIVKSRRLTYKLGP
jgi:hypothetical protein